MTRRLGLLPLLLLTAACRSLQPVPVEFINETQPPYITISDGYSLTEIANPRLIGDSVLGTTMTGDQTISIPLRHVQQISTVRFNSGRTVLLVGSVVAIGALATYAMLAGGGNAGPINCDVFDPRDVHEREQCGFNVIVGR